MSALFGGALYGDKLVRLTYLDESGLFNAGQEPYIVVGGVIINADSKMELVENRIDDLIQKHIPEEDRNGFVFHATELWSGGRYFKRDKWSQAKRWEILMDLVNIIPEIRLPLVCGRWSRKLELENPGRLKKHDQEKLMHCLAFLDACTTIELYMRQVAQDEITILVAEHNGEIVKTSKETFVVMQGEELLTEPAFRQMLPLQKIKDTIHFATKNESKCLQIADLCTFFSKKRLVKDKAARPFYDVLKPFYLVEPLSYEDVKFLQ
jgi:hypothetical protein